MAKLKYTLSCLMLLLSVTAFSQGYLINSGNLVINSGTSVIISGGYQNATGGQVTLDGTISLTGDWTNNDNSAQVLVSPTSHSGTTVFAGSSTQTIGGSSTTVYEFENLTINSTATVNVTAAMAVTADGATTLNGILDLKNDGNNNPKLASFIDNGTITGSGTLHAEAHLAGAGGSGTPTGRGWYVSSPVSNATSSAFGFPSGYDSLAYWVVSPDGTKQAINISKMGQLP